MSLRVAAALKQQAGVTVAPRDLFFPTLRQVAAMVEASDARVPARAS